MSFDHPIDAPGTPGSLPASLPKPRQIDKRRNRQRKISGRAPGRPASVKAMGLRARAWHTIRLLRQFTLNDLLDINATGQEKDAFSNLLKYLAKLEQYGVLLRLARRAGDAQFGPGCVVWRLAHDLGWDAPVWRTAQKVLWNPNTGAPVALPVPGDAA